MKTNLMTSWLTLLSKVPHGIIICLRWKFFFFYITQLKWLKTIRWLQSSINEGYIQINRIIAKKQYEVIKYRKFFPHTYAYHFNKSSSILIFTNY